MLRFLVLLNIFLMSGCITKLITQLPPEKAAKVVKSMAETKKHYQTVTEHYEKLDKFYEKLLKNMEDQRNLYLLQLETFTKMANSMAESKAIKEEMKKFLKKIEDKQKEAVETQKLASLSEGEMSISYNKAINTHRETKKHAELYWWDEQSENHSSKRLDYLIQARAYKNQAQRYESHSFSEAQKTLKKELNPHDSIKSSILSYFKYFDNMKQAFQSYREAIKHGNLEIKHRRKELERIREVRI